MIKLFLILIFLFSGSLNATIIDGFVGPYKASNWEVTPVSGYPENAAIDITKSSKEGIEFLFSNPTSDWVSGYLTYTTVTKGTGLVSFDLLSSELSTPAGAGFGQFAIATLNDTESNIICSFNSMPGSGTCGYIAAIGLGVKMHVNSGQSFGIAMHYSIDPTVNIAVLLTNFSAPVSVSEPNTKSLFIISVLLLLAIQYKSYLRPSH